MPTFFKFYFYQSVLVIVYLSLGSIFVLIENSRGEFSIKTFFSKMASSPLFQELYDFHFNLIWFDRNFVNKTIRLFQELYDFHFNLIWFDRNFVNKTIRLFQELYDFHFNLIWFDRNFVNKTFASFPRIVGFSF